ncbi:hypothetical protein DFP72DRAFT_1143478 [Ephemerocybe angulata]|uniref:Uncharacterized protein n=1 Tax=Ephemerocybe angulata TaxID=980116 RepID=A0A8H6HMF8_9AGAR|nr:hypothetical protein DFP72DRAFT_1143478 [Tulosesus angulatus]
MSNTTANNSAFVLSIIAAIHVPPQLVPIFRTKLEQMLAAGYVILAPQGTAAPHAQAGGATGGATALPGPAGTPNAPTTTGSALNTGAPTATAAPPTATAAAPTATTPRPPSTRPPVTAAPPAVTAAPPTITAAAPTAATAVTNTAAPATAQPTAPAAPVAGPATAPATPASSPYHNSYIWSKAHQREIFGGETYDEWSRKSSSPIMADENDSVRTPAQAKYLTTCGCFAKQAKRMGQYDLLVTYATAGFWERWPVPKEPIQTLKDRIANSKKLIIQDLKWAEYSCGPTDPNIPFEALFALGSREFFYWRTECVRAVTAVQAARTAQPTLKNRIDLTTLDDDDEN